MVSDYMNARSDVERYDILERESRRKSATKGEKPAALEVPPSAITEAYLRHTMLHPALGPVRVQEGQNLGKMLWHDIYEGELQQAYRCNLGQVTP